MGDQRLSSLLTGIGGVGLSELLAEVGNDLYVFAIGYLRLVVTLGFPQPFGVNRSQ